MCIIHCILHILMYKTFIHKLTHSYIYDTSAYSMLNAGYRWFRSISNSGVAQKETDKTDRMN